MARREDRKQKEQKSPKLPEFISPEKKKEKMREEIRRKFQEAFGYEDFTDKRAK